MTDPIDTARLRERLDNAGSLTYSGTHALLDEIDRLRAAHSTVEAELTANERAVEKLQLALKDAVSTATENARQRDVALADCGRLRAELAEARAMQECACGYDDRNDVCLGHAKILERIDARLRAELAEARRVMERCAVIVERSLYRQHEKIEDVPRLLRQHRRKTDG